MKLVSLKIKASGAPTVGAVIGEAYLDLHAASGGELPATMIGFLEQGEAAMERARALSADVAQGHENLYQEHEVELLAPVPKAGQRSCTPPVISPPTSPSWRPGVRRNGSPTTGATSTLSIPPVSWRRLPRWCRAAPE